MAGANAEGKRIVAAAPSIKDPLKGRQRRGREKDRGPAARKLWELALVKLWPGS